MKAIFSQKNKGQGPTNIFDKTCPRACGMQKALARQDELVVQYHVWKSMPIGIHRILF